MNGKVSFVEKVTASLVTREEDEEEEEEEGEEGGCRWQLEKQAGSHLAGGKRGTCD